MELRQQIGRIKRITATDLINKMKDKKICKHPGCDRPVHANGFCNMHNTRDKRGQDMDAPCKVTQRNKPIFIDNVAPPNKDGCELWTGVVNEKGYGIFKKIKAHRYQKGVIDGEDIENKVVRHVCIQNGVAENNKLCMSHLQVGTKGQNNADPDRIGENHGSAKISNRVQKQVVQYLKRKPEVTQKEMAKVLNNLRFEVSRQTISNWMRGKYRSHNSD